MEASSLHLKFFAHFIVKVFQQLAAGAWLIDLIDFQTQFELELVEGGLDFLLLAAALVDGGDALLEIHAAFDGAQHFVAGAKDALEKLKLFGQQFERRAWSAAFLRLRKFTTTTSCFCP